MQKRTPLAGFLGAVHVTPGGVQQHGFGAEEPIAVACATQAGDPCTFALGIGEAESRLVDHRAFAGSRLADHQVPGQGIQHILGRGATRLVAVQAFDALQQALTQQADFLAVGRVGVEHRLVSVVTQQRFEVVVLRCATVEQQDIARRQQQEQTDTCQQAVQRGKPQAAPNGPDDKDRQEKAHPQNVGLVAQAVVFDLVHTNVASSASTKRSIT
ncbi:hypothetical protein D3C78_637080 [compost metagenome]